MSRFINYSYIRDHLSIEQVALNNGFSHVKGKTSTKWPVLKNEAGLKIIVGKGNQGLDYYFNPDFEQDKGSVITFLKNHPEVIKWQPIDTFFHQELGDAIFDRDYISQNINSNSKEKYSSTQGTINWEINNTFDLEEHNLRELNRNSPAIQYLAYRRIPESVFFHESIASRIGVTAFASNGRSFENITFPIYTNNIDRLSIQETICGLCKVGVKKNIQTNETETFKYFAPGSLKSNGIWTSNPNIAIDKKQMPQIIVTESPIDALSLFAVKQMHKSNALLVSTMGQVTQGQINEILKLGIMLAEHCNVKHSASNIITAMDNDIKGQGFNIMLKCALGAVQGAKSYYNTLNVDENSPLITQSGSLQTCTFRKNDTEHIKLTVTLHDETPRAVIESVKNELINAFNKESVTSTTKIIQDKAILNFFPFDTPKYEQIELTTIATKENLIKIDDVLTALTGIRSVRSKRKDWNEDLHKECIQNKQQTSINNISLKL